MQYRALYALRIETKDTNRKLKLKVTDRMDALEKLKALKYLINKEIKALSKLTKN